MAKAVATAKPQEYEEWVYQSDAGYKGQIGGPKVATEESVLFSLAAAFPESESEPYRSHGSPFVFFETADGAVEYVGGVDALREWASANFADEEEVQAQNVNPMARGVVNMFGNEVPGFTVPSPLPGS